jgi:outer membrane protein assembly factor BamB
MPLRLATVGLLAALLIAGAARAGPFPRSNDGEWLSYGHDSQLTNAVVSPVFRPSTVPDLSERWRTELDGPVVASPLYAEPLIDGRRTSAVYASTEAGSTYALQATDGRVLWQRTSDTFDASCSSFGISSTGAIDRDASLLYVIGADGKLHARDLATGDDSPGYPLDVIPFPTRQYVWGGLRIVGRELYVPFATYCDDIEPGDRMADGGVIAVNLDAPAKPLVFDPVDGEDNGGGIWGYGGLSAEPDGSFLYTGVGNAHVYDPACDCDLENVGFGEHLIKLTPDLRVVDSNFPPGVEAQGDQDFGSSPLLFQPHGCPPLAAANNKSGTLFIWDRTDLSRGPLTGFGVGDAIAPFVGQPSWSSRLQTLFDAEAHVVDGETKIGNGVAAIKATYEGCLFNEVWRTNVGDGNQAPPLVVGDVVFVGGGTGGLYALDGRTGTILWEALTDGDRTFSPVIEARRTLFAPVGNGVRAFGFGVSGAR